MKLVSLAICASLIFTDIAKATTLPSSSPSDKLPPITKLVVEKNKRQMTAHGKDGVVKVYRIALGFNPLGHKEKQGDGKTPEGCYRICSKNPNSKYHKSLRVSYPSLQDLKICKEKGIHNPGGDIMVHGLGKRLAHKGKLHYLQNWTLGCIALTDEEIEEIYDAITVGATIEIKA